MGWQSWWLESDAHRLLVDPLLVDTVGRGPSATHQRVSSWPPRRFEWSALPPVDAVLLSHEHEDHFSVPSLARIDRRVPIWLSSRSSVAARTLLAELGFEVTLVEPETTRAVGDLELRTFTTDHRDGEQQDEWDTLAYLVRGEGGSFFTNVDVEISPAMRERLSRALAPGEQCLCYVNMALGLDSHVLAPPAGAMHRPPAGVPRLAAPEALARLHEGALVQPCPGQTAVLSGGRLASLEERAPFLDTPPRATWPSPPAFWPPADAPLAPLLGGGDLDDEQVAALERELDHLAAYLYGRALFRELYSLAPEELGGRVASFVLLLRAGDDVAYAYRYCPQACSFEALDELEALDQRFAGLVVGWAGDLLAAFQGVFEPRALVRSVRERWAVPMRSSVVVHSLWPYLHPLRQPARCLAKYREIAAQQANAPILVRARGPL